MKFEIIIIAVTLFLIANTYHEGKYVQLLKSWKKYYQMIGIGFVGLSAYAYIKKYPANSRGLLQNANGFIKYMPIDKEAGDFLTPVLNMSKDSFFGPYNNVNYNTTNIGGMSQAGITPQHKRMLNSGSGQTKTKRSVSETKKKYVASQQDWKCGKCGCKLPAWFEVDHKRRLDSGGDNHIDNLVALCRDCHGEKTAFENF